MFRIMWVSARQCEGSEDNEDDKGNDRRLRLRVLAHKGNDKGNKVTDA